MAGQIVHYRKHWVSIEEALLVKSASCTSITTPSTRTATPGGSSKHGQAAAPVAVVMVLPRPPSVKRRCSRAQHVRDDSFQGR
jgi:hypothetical protein